MSKITETNEKIAKKVVAGYKKIEEGVVEGYKKIETGTVEGFEKVTDKCVETLFTQKGESVENTKKRLSEKSKIFINVNTLQTFYKKITNIRTV